jgi:hypothetical protein
VPHRVLDLGVFRISMGDGWEDITASLDDTDAPFTFADPISGVGALQLSPALYRDGRLPKIARSDLTEMLNEFADMRELGKPIDRSSDSEGMVIEGARFHSGDDLVRVWYGSDGVNLMLVTYVCEWDHRDRESAQIEMAVRSVRFAASTD